MQRYRQARLNLKVAAVINTGKLEHLLNMTVKSTAQNLRSHFISNTTFSLNKALISILVLQIICNVKKRRIE